jgi:hypothetical protein
MEVLQFNYSRSKNTEKKVFEDNAEKKAGKMLRRVPQKMLRKMSQ